jgi:hypothetical protein
MARYRTTVLSSTAIAADTAFYYLMSVAGNGYSLLRVTASLETVGSSSAPPDQDCVLGIAPATAGPTGAPTTTTVTKLKPIYPTNQAVSATTYATTSPTFGAATADAHRISVSSRGGYEGIWEPSGGQDFDVNSGVTNGLVFVNRANALTSPLAWLICVEWNE